MTLGVWQIALIALVVLILFGRGRISEMMGDFGKGISSFKKGLNEEVDTSDKNNGKPAGQLESPTIDVKPANTTKAETNAAERSDPEN